MRRTVHGNDLWQTLCLSFLVMLSVVVVAMGGRQFVAASAAAELPPVGLPMRLAIPVIGVDAAVESVGLTSEGLMDVPQNFDEVAWYQLGPRPGEPGNAVIDGHVDSAIQGTAVFWKLRTLVPGDVIIVTGDNGTTHRFVVTGIERYDDANAPLARIYGPADGAHLNLVTCDQTSSFDRHIGSYLGSYVIYTDAAAEIPTQ